ncbi:MAG: LysR family transcriptional regulator [Granulosicoccus sp.]|nr:LysR family transcriptional regulator [Granulosicoccus sp.]
MRLEWLDDLIAIMDSATLSEAAQRRHLTQPAFSRRIRTIEAAVGIDLLDRSRKPVRLTPSAGAHEARIRDIAQALRVLRDELGRGDTRSREIVFASQHAISTAIAPRLVCAITDSLDVRVRLRSANHDDCYSLLLTRKADIALLFQLDDEPLEHHGQLVESHRLARDPLVPVIAPEHRQTFQRQTRQGVLRIIGYPREVFLGEVLHRVLKPQLDPSLTVLCVAETALTTAALEFSLAGAGLAWVPLSLASKALATGELVRLDPEFPLVSMCVSALRTTRGNSSSIDSAWKLLTAGDTRPNEVDS